MESLPDDEVLTTNVDWIEPLYAQYLENPSSLDPAWCAFFASLERKQPKFVSAPPVEQAVVVPTAGVEVSSDIRIFHLIQSYRIYGHLLADVNPIATELPSIPRQLQLSTLGFAEEELSQPFPTCGLLVEPEAPLEEIISTLQEIYCRTIGVEYIDLHSPALEEWLQQQIEPNRFRVDLSIDDKRLILQELNKSELLESFIHTKYTGQKRFSLEGAETLIPMLSTVVVHSAEQGIEEIVLGMPHRGRLNVLANILNKSYSDIFVEFDANYLPPYWEGSGDVKYHKGFYAEINTSSNKKLKITLTPNPSHLESVDPVVEGQARARQERQEGHDRQKKILPILIHGDAALAGQGVVYETLQFCKLPHYETGGTIHFVVNNQIGFTTHPKEGRSTYACTDIAKAFGAPVFHVNAEDPEGCVFVTQLAIALRQKFRCDVFIDLNCWRKYGHNETDEPAFTQPLEYQLIRKKKPIRELYRDRLIQEGIVEKYLAEELEKEFRSGLQQAMQSSQSSREHQQKEEEKREGDRKDFFSPFPSGVPLERLQEVADQISIIPHGFTLHPKLQRLVKERREMLFAEKPIDWGMAELLAYGTLLWEGYDVRLAGQDSRRGTFSHRHAAWMDQELEQAYIPLQNLHRNQGRFTVVNSTLSEMAALGFEYGYSFSMPDALVLWEAQFGDFSNGAQVVIDQYVSTGENKWAQTSSLVLLLPHGYEGQGPEHSSARMERFLQLCGNDNMIVANPTTPAQFFHLLRRHRCKPLKKPLIVFTPKGLLRHPRCISHREDLANGHFSTILADAIAPEKGKTVVFCSGRIYYDLLAEREKRDREDIVLLRIEQLYPLDSEAIQKAIEPFRHLSRAIWAQEEPRNMGAWHFIQPKLSTLLPKNLALEGVTRPRSASPATGSHALHQKEHSAIIHQIFSSPEVEIEEIEHHFRV